MWLLNVYLAAMKQYYNFEHIKILEPAIPAKIMYKIRRIFLHKKKFLQHKLGAGELHNKL